MSVRLPGSRWYNAVWRWHFYAGLFCVPFVLWLAVTGSIYAWRPQIEAWLDRPYDSLAPAAARASPEAIAAAAVAAVPGSRLHKYELPQSNRSAVRVLVGTDSGDRRVYVDPYRLTTLAIVTEDERPMQIVSHLHGELLAGAWGSYIVEIAACWTLVMILTGLYLWWPRGRKGLAGVLYPRLSGGRRLLWRDLHAVTGIWASLFALFVVTTGLPWAKAWGSYFKEIRTVTGTLDGPIDWTIGGRKASDDPMLGEHAGHMGMAMVHQGVRPGELNRAVVAATALHFAPPVLVSPPGKEPHGWTVTSDAGDRPLRAQAVVNGTTGAVLARKDFAERHWIDRAVGYGIATHEGQLFGIANQLLITLGALMLMILSVSGAISWWRRRPSGRLGAPLPLSRPRFGGALIAAIVALGVAMPLFGVSLLMVLLVERGLKSWSGIARWLGLRTVRA
ncbi:PepSY domain-containing protein [Sphingomonas sp.]|uniref:PepSY-associated TM helix domain-containing protein n=1 Tax=Sphingomonas sp. TaxID=28214 RepID=UPI0025DE4DDE|nr:PepSY domain-containing protein [Sphingomonas sp.]